MGHMMETIDLYPAEPILFIKLPLLSPKARSSWSPVLCMAPITLAIITFNTGYRNAGRTLLRQYA